MKKLLFLSILLIFFSCSDENKITVSRNYPDYIIIDKITLVDTYSKKYSSIDNDYYIVISGFDKDENEYVIKRILIHPYEFNRVNVGDTIR